MTHIFPTLWSDSVTTVQKTIDRLLVAKNQISTLQLDITDGEFVDDMTIFPSDLHEINFYDFQIDLHLMTNYPIQEVLECTLEDNVRAIIAQVEHMENQDEFISEVKKLNKKVGLSVDLYTPVEAIEKSSWKHINIVQVMGYQAGVHNQTFKGDMVLDKIKKVKDQMSASNKNNIGIFVDGGITLKTGKKCVKAGATGLCVGRFLHQSDDIPSTLQQLQSL